MKYIVIVNSIEVQLAATKIKYVHSIPIQCWVNVSDAGSTFHRYRNNQSLLNILLYGSDNFPEDTNFNIFSLLQAYISSSKRFST